MAQMRGVLADRFTGKSIHEEASIRSRTFDLVSTIRIRRLRWLGHILRMPDNRLVKLAVKVQFEKGTAGNITTDVPDIMTFAELCTLAADRKRWKEYIIGKELS